MKLRFLIELLLILIIIAFAASSPVDRGGKNTRRHLRRVTGTVRADQNSTITRPPAPASSGDDDDDDDDDLFDLDDDYDDDSGDNSVKDDKKDPVTSGTSDSEDDDDDDLFGITDLFQAILEDDDEDKKKKTNITSAINSVIPSEASVGPPPASDVTIEQSPLPATPIKQEIPHSDTLNQKKENITRTPVAESSKPTMQLHLQHTPALLELAQGSHSQNISTHIPKDDQQSENVEFAPAGEDESLMDKTTIIIEPNDGEKIAEESEILTMMDEESDENGEFIVVPDATDTKNENQVENNQMSEDQEDIPQEESQPEEDESTHPIKNTIPHSDEKIENTQPQNDKDVLISSETLSTSQVVQQEVEKPLQTTENKPVEVVKPKPPKEEDDSLLGVIESLIFDEDSEDDESKPTKTDGSDAEKEEEDEEEDDDDVLSLELVDDDDDEDEDEENESQQNQNIPQKQQQSSANAIQSTNVKKKATTANITKRQAKKFVGKTINPIPGKLRKSQKKKKTEK